MLNRKWRAIEMIEMIKMAICDLEDVIGSAGFTKEDQDWVWPIKYEGFEVH